MKIKSIEIVGFKSFPERMKVAFPEGISAVVGPNGCGKSNIVDAIRWVMGEQSAKGLRGNQMDDVLFSGARDHQPSGLAEASLTLSNENGHSQSAVLGPSEITITRRLYRSGDSEYLINNVPCRLKDIIQFLMDTGLGTRTYSIIEQGRIGNLVDSKPEERRALIDEAAGITRYKYQKREAERKIEATEQNLLHIQTLMNETKRQYNGLTRASKKAARYKLLKSEYQGLDLTLACFFLNDLDNRHSVQAARREELRSRLVGFQAETEKLEVQLEESRLSILEHEKTAEAKAEVYYALKNEHNSLSQEQDFIHDQTSVNRTRHENLAEELVRLKDQQEARRRERDDYKKEEAALINDLGNLEKVQTKAQSGLKDLARDHALGIDVRDKLQRSLSEIHNKLGRLEEQIAAHSRMAGDLAVRRSEIDREREGLQTESGRLAGLTRELSGQADGLTAERQDIEEALAHERDALASLRFRFKSLDEEGRQKESAHAALASRLATLEDVQARFGWYSEAVQALMQSPEMKAAGVLGPVAERIKAPSGYETALEAGLAERLQYVLVKDRGTAVECLKFLENANKGRCGLISMADLGNGAEQDLARALLGEYELADDLAGALEFWPDKTVLTRDGCFLQRGGLLIGGKPSQEEQGLLARRREIEQLSERVSELETEKEALAERVRSCQTEIDQAVSVIEEREGVLRELSVSSLDVEKRLTALNIRREEVENRLNSLAQSAQRQEAERRQLTADKDQALRESQKLKNFSFDLNRELEEAEQHVIHLSERITEAREKHQEISLKVNTLAGRQKALRQDQVRLEEWLRETEAVAASKDRELVEAEAEAERLAARKDEIAVLLDGAADRIAEAEEDVGRARARVDSLRERLNVRETEARAARRAREEKSDELNKLELDIQEGLLRRQNLVERIENDYRLDLDNLPASKRPQPDAVLNVDEARERLEDLKGQIEAMGEVNLSAISEEEALKERYEFYRKQYDDLTRSIENLRESIARINRSCNIRFNKVFKAVDEKLREIFPLLFEGGEAWLALTDENDPLESGVEIQVHPPGKKVTVMSLLSGGEKALVALTLIFALYLIKPSPFCLLDEIDAPLDEANIDRFNKLLKKLGQSSQIILVTHNKRTMQMAQTLYGVTMEEPGVSKMVSVNLSDFEEDRDEKLVQAI